ncbi:hypothetical protein QUF72_08520 [Desulfobacterales bacterium HSG2]|nr:hypothetical protein [Desulfobacterales bacterium HSG2]
MEEESPPIVQKQIAELLRKRKKDYLTVTQIRNGLSAALLKRLGIAKHKSRAGDVLSHLKPYLGTGMSAYKGPKSVYIGFDMSMNEIILDKIRRNPGMSPKNLARNLPMIKKDFIANLNKLLETGDVICTFSESHTPRLKISCKIGGQTTLEERPIDGRAVFKAACEKVGKGQKFVRIHRIREYLDWPGERFDRMLMHLMADYTIELHGGDPSIMTEKEIKDSFTDENGLLYINLTWWGKDDER